MDNQHKKIKGYRDLSQAEIDLMNRIKTAGAALLDLHAEVVAALHAQYDSLSADAHRARQNLNIDYDKPEVQACVAFQTAEPFRWAAIAKTDIQTGLMALIRSVAQPTI